MKNRSHGYVCVFVLALLLEISLTPICHAEIINVARRTEREVSVEATPQPRENTNLVNPIDHDFQRSAVEESVDRPNSHGSKERADYAEEAALEDEKMSNLVRLPRSVDLRYTDQDERSSLYDDYEAKDVAKRGAEDYEEVEEDSPEEDVAALREEESDKPEKKETRSEARMKRSQATLDSKWSASNLLESKDETSSELRLDPRSLEESEITADESSSNIKSSRGIDEPSLLDNNALKKRQRSTSSEAISSSSGASAKDTSAEYEKRAEERIQRKIDSIKDEIRRDIEAQRRIRDIQENNAKFDEIQDEESRSFEDDSVKKKRQSVAKKRSIRDVSTDVSSKRILYEEPQRRSRESGRSNNSPKKRLSHEKPKRSAKGSDESSGQSPSKGFFKKKRERVRETILVRKDRHRAEKRHSRSNALASGGNDGKLRNDLSADSNSYLRVNDGMAQAPLVNEGENNDERQSLAGRGGTLMSVTGSSQELSPRLAKEYKEAFGGLQSESSNALARFKRVKRVLGSPDVKI